MSTLSVSLNVTGNEVKTIFQEVKEPVLSEPILKDIMLSKVEQDKYNKYSCIHLFGRTKKNKFKKLHFRVFGFLPNFFVFDKQNPEQVRESYFKNQIIDITKDNVVKKSLIGNKKVTKIVVKDSNNVSKIRDEVFYRENTNSADIIFKDNFKYWSNIISGFDVDLRDCSRNIEFFNKGFNFEQTHKSTDSFYSYNNIITDFNEINENIIYNNIIDLVSYKNIKAKDVFFEPRKHYFDIETDNYNKKKSSWENPVSPITHIGFYDNYVDKLYVYTYKAKAHEKKKIKRIVDRFINITCKYEFKKSKKEVKWKIKTFDTEEEMLMEYVKFFINNDPDIMMAWNIQFDINYLINRIKLKYKKLKIDNVHYYTYKSLSPMNSVNFDSFSQRYEIKGINVFCLYWGYRELTKTKGMMDSYKLGDTGKRHINYGKIEYEKTIGYNWRYHFVKILKYNARDVELIIELDKDLQISNYFWIRSRTTGCSMKDVFSESRNIDSDIIRFAIHHLGASVPNSRKIIEEKGKKKDKEKGAVVFEPEIGMYKDVLFFDLKSWYYTIMYSINLSPDVLTKPKIDTINIDLFKIRDQLAKELKKGNELRKAVNIPQNIKISLRQDKDGIIKQRMHYYNLKRNSYRNTMLICDKLFDYFQEKDNNNNKIIKKEFNDKKIGNIFTTFKMQLLSIKRYAYLENADFDNLVKDLEDIYELSIDTIIINMSLINELKNRIKIYEMFQTSQKFMVNSFYGVMLYKKFRLFNKKVGASIPLIGVIGLLFTRDVIESEKLKNQIKKKFGIIITLLVIYGDTDSLAVAGLDKVKKLALQKRLAIFISKYLTMQYSRFIKKFFNSDTCNMSIRCEKILWVIAFIKLLKKIKKGDREGAKKKYFYLSKCELSGDKDWKKNIELKSKGFGKSDMPKGLKPYEKKLQKLLCLYKIGKIGRDKIIKHVKKIILTGKKMSPEDLCFRKSIKPLEAYADVHKDEKGNFTWLDKKPPIHVRSAIYSISNLGVEIDAHQKVKYVYVKKPMPPKTKGFNETEGKIVTELYPETNVVAFNDEKEIADFNINYNKQMESFLKSINNLLSLVNLSIEKDIMRKHDDIISKIKQKSKKVEKISNINDYTG